jgi:HlyD family secretion protein
MKSDSDIEAFTDSKATPSQPQPFPPRLRLLMIAIASLGVGAVILASINPVSEYLQSRLTPAETVTPVQTPIVPTKVTALGRLEPQGEVIDLSAPSLTEGARIEELRVEEGDWVRRGEVIAILDNRDRLEAALKQAEKEIQLRQAELEQVKAGAKQGEIVAQQAEIARLEAQLQRQQQVQQSEINRLQALLNGEIATEEATIARLKAELRNAEIEYQRYESLSTAGAISQSIYDSKQMTWETAQERVKEAEATLKRKVETIQQQIQEAKTTLTQIQETGQEQITRAIATLDQIAEVRPTDIQAAEAAIEQAIAAQEKAEADLKLSSVRSPMDGQVLKIHAYPGERISNTEGIVELGQTDQMYVIAEVYETDIHLVKIGQSVLITSNAFTEELIGKVDQIGLQIGKKDVLDTDPAADTDARVVEVKIPLDQNSSERVAGLTYLQVDVKILLEP